MVQSTTATTSLLGCRPSTGTPNAGQKTKSARMNLDISNLCDAVWLGRGRATPQVANLLARFGTKIGTTPPLFLVWPSVMVIFLLEAV